ncbi:hypothetical protein DPSP01_014518 [Paraphaeosphaeria sporulosa]
MLPRRVRLMTKMNIWRVSIKRLTTTYMLTSILDILKAKSMGAVEVDEQLDTDGECDVVENNIDAHQGTVEVHAHADGRHVDLNDVKHCDNDLEDHSYAESQSLRKATIVILVVAVEVLAADRLAERAEP